MNPIIFIAIISIAIQGYGVYIDESFTAADIACHSLAGQTHGLFEVYSVNIKPKTLNLITTARTNGILTYDLFVYPNRNLPGDQDPVKIARDVNQMFTNTSARVWIGVQNKAEWISGDQIGNLMYIKSMVYEFLGQGRTVGIFTTYSVWSLYFSDESWTTFISVDPLSPDFKKRTNDPLYKAKFMYIGNDDTNDVYNMGSSQGVYRFGGWGYDWATYTNYVPAVMKAMPNNNITCSHIYGVTYY